MYHTCAASSRSDRLSSQSSETMGPYRNCLQSTWLGVCLVFVGFSSVGRQTSAFTTVTSSWSHPPLTTSRRKVLPLQSSFFDDVGRFFEELGGNKKNDENEAQDNDEDDYVGTTRLVSIPVESIKPGGLRLLLMFYLMGMQNTPERNSWKADQPSREEYAVDMYYHDRTAALMVRLSDSQVIIDRMGTAPSMSYLMQESIIVDGILDELQLCVFDGDVADHDRLLVLPEPKDAIQKARESLAFG